MSFQSRYNQLPEHFYREVTPTPLKNPFLISWNHSLAEEMGLGDTLTAEKAADYFGAMKPLSKTPPIATAYAGHQFGHYVPQLGDGRSILLGEWKNGVGEHWDLHLKGGGRTPYSRSGDGRAVLRSTIREYLCSEAMHHLGIPTTRALCMVGSEEEVHRESIEYGATLLRTAPNHIRFGTFEYFYYRQEYEPLQQLLNHLVKFHFPQLNQVAHTQQALELFKIVVTRTAQLIAQWQLVGFAHGVMNSDNMSILGFTIDYGPYGFLDHYEPGFICNHSDHSGRYAFNQQPEIAQWNMRCLAQALLPLLEEEPEAGAELLREELQNFQTQYQAAYDHGLSAKLGLSFREGDQTLQLQWLQLLESSQADYTRSFRALSDSNKSQLQQEIGNQAGLTTWLSAYHQRLQSEATTTEERAHAMRQVNPKYILRNYLAQQAIEQAEAGDYREIERLLELLHNPYDDQPQFESYAATAPEWSKSLSVSCSS
mgnify:FL=1